MSKLRERTTATLLIAIFMISIFAVAIPVSAQTTWTVPGDFATIQEAIDSTDVLDGDTILVGPGEWFGAVVTKSVEIKGTGGAVIVDGPPHTACGEFGFKLESGSSGTTISHFRFQGIGLPIYGWGVDDVTIEHNKIYDTVQGITNWDGNNWVIKQNVIDGIYATNGGGIGICVGSRYEDVIDNIVAQNKLTAYIPNSHTFGTCGILLCTDKRYSDWDPGEVKNNKIVHNKVKITGPLSDALALEVLGLSDPPTDEDITYATGILHHNIVGFNDLRGSDGFIAYYPDELEFVNTVSRNLGKDVSRGHGEVPANIFKPVN